MVIKIDLNWFVHFRETFQQILNYFQHNPQMVFWVIPIWYALAYIVTRYYNSYTDIQYEAATKKEPPDDPVFIAFIIWLFSPIIFLFILWEFFAKGLVRIKKTRSA